MSRFINDDVKLKKGGRFAPIISMDKFKQILLNKAHKIEMQDDFLEEDDYEFNEDFDFDDDYCLYLLFNAFLEDETLMKDAKYIFDFENTIGLLKENIYFKKDIGSHLIGFHTLSNGIPFLGFVAGGDWETPIFAIYYYDGKRIRMYIPSYGNTINLDTKTAFGSESHKEQHHQNLIKKYEKLGIDCSEYWNEINTPNNNWNKEFNANGYLSKYYMENYDILSKDDLAFNWDAIKEDIESRLEVR